MKKIINVGLYILKRVLLYRIYSIQWCNDILSKHPCNLEKKQLKKLCRAYKKRWRPLSRLVSDKYFKVFANYTNSCVDVVPEDILHHIMEPVLNPLEYQNCYENKNLFSIFLSPSVLPKEILRKIDGFFYTRSYEFIDESNVRAFLQSECLENKRYILKPSVDSCSGRGIVFFEKKHDSLCLVDANIDVLKYVKQNKLRDFVVQECVKQSRFMQQFNDTSVNTIRVCVYKSVVTNISHVTAAIMRIGKRKSLVDNAHAGGMFVGVSLNGTLGKYVVDQYGNKCNLFNDIDFSKKTYIIPNFDKVIAFSEKIADELISHRLFALDVMIDEEGNPVLIEYNLTDFSSWLFEFTGNSPFGMYTDEIIEYCSKKKNTIKRLLLA